MRRNRGQSPISIELVNGFPIADWGAVRKRVDALPVAQRSDAWLESERVWLIRFREAREHPGLDLGEIIPALLEK